MTDQTIRGQPATFAIDVAFSQSEANSGNGVVWEIMQPIANSGLAGSAKTLMEEFLDMTGGKGGVQHVAFDMNCGGEAGGDVGNGARQEALRRREEFAKRGFEVAMSGIWYV